MFSAFRLFLLLSTCAGVKFNHSTGDDYSLCGTKTCVKKCCPEKHVLSKKVCVLSDISDFSFDVYEGMTNISDKNITFYVVHDNNANCGGKTIMKLSPSFNQEDEFYVQADGTMFKPYDAVTRSVEFSDYCLENFVFSSRPMEFSALVCYVEGNLEKIDRFCYIGE